ncbi:MAG: DUF5317 domain-containing protein [Chloroflexota bacterium]|nr:DUF5317 domain-containing protein [Chloroflexota bacterium]
MESTWSPLGLPWQVCGFHSGFGIVASYVVLLLALVRDLRRPAVAPIFVGATLNLAVIAANGGLMPVSPETLARIAPPGHDQPAQVGDVLPHGKDVVLDRRDTRLWWFSDTLTLPRRPVSARVAFSVGDILISLGLLWMSVTFGLQLLRRSLRGSRESDESGNEDSRACSILDPGDVKR